MFSKRSRQAENERRKNVNRPFYPDRKHVTVIKADINSRLGRRLNVKTIAVSAFL